MKINNPRKTIITMAIYAFVAIAIGCSADIEEEINGDLSDMWGKSYKVVATRSNSNAPWYLVEGQSYVTFTGEYGATEGSMLINFSSYYEPQYCNFGQVCSCDGNVTYAISNGGASSGSTGEPGSEDYNVFDPYNPGTTEEEVVEGNVREVIRHSITAKPTITNLSSGCPAQITKPLTLERFESGQVIIHDGNKQTALKRM
nr:hypothetical protein BdHM001_35370 [Bdellovibrio sp. HM001]